MTAHGLRALHTGPPFRFALRVELLRSGASPHLSDHAAQHHRPAPGLLPEGLQRALRAHLEEGSRGRAHSKPNRRVGSALSVAGLALAYGPGMPLAWILGACYFLTAIVTQRWALLRLHRLPELAFDAKVRACVLDATRATWCMYRPPGELCMCAPRVCMYTAHHVHRHMRR